MPPEYFIREYEMSVISHAIPFTKEFEMKIALDLAPDISIYPGIDNIARKTKSLYVGVNGIARKVKSAYVGIDGVAKRIKI